jgi:hypothetical protein
MICHTDIIAQSILPNAFALTLESTNMIHSFYIIVIVIVLVVTVVMYKGLGNALDDCST